MTAQDQLSIGLLPTKIILSKTTVSILILLLVSGVVFSFAYKRMNIYWQLPSSFQWDIKWSSFISGDICWISLEYCGGFTKDYL